MLKCCPQSHRQIDIQIDIQPAREDIAENKKTDLDIYFLERICQIFIFVEENLKKSKSNNGIIIVFTSSVTILPMKAFCSIIKFISLTPFDVGKSLVGVAEGFASCGMFKYLRGKNHQRIFQFFNFLPIFIFDWIINF